jgi:hypothetical protein
MADLNFPDPNIQTTYSFVGKTWNWDGQRWAFVSSGSGITKLNDLTASVQNFLIGYTGAFPNIVSSGSDHTFNIPIAGTAATGLVNTSSQSFAGAKTFTSTTNATYIGVGGVVVHGGIAISGNAAIGGSAIFTNTANSNTISFYSGVQGSTLAYILPIDTPTAGQVLSASAPSSGVVTLSWEDDQTGAPAGGITQLNGLTAATQSFQTGTAGNDFAISSATSTHTFNLPDASATARGVITTGSQTIAGAKTFSSSIIGNLSGTATTSENVNVTTTTRSLTHYLTFTNASSGSGLALTTSAVGIGFTVNPAQNTLAAGTFIGNLSGTAATATNFYGNLVGNVSGTATTSQNVNVTTTTRTFDHYLIFTNASSGSGLALTTSAVGSGLTYNPATNTLNALFFTGTATTARNLEITTTTRSVDHYLLFANATSGNGLGVSTSAVGMGLTYNPATNTLSAQFFTGTATTSRNVDVTTTTRSFTHYLTFTNATSGSGLALTTSAIGIGFTVNPAQNTLAAGTFIGNLSGTAVTATNFYGSLSGTATTAQNINTTSADSAGNHYLLFSPVNATASGVAVSSDSGLSFVPTTNVLTTNVFNGNLSATGATVTSILDVQGDAALGNATADTVTFNARIGSHFNPTANTTYDLGLPSFAWRNTYLTYITGTAVTATNFYGTLTGNVTGTATTATNINTTAATTGGAHYLLFSPTNATASGVAVSSDTTLQFNPSTNVLSTDVFSGNFTGTAATATNFYGTLTGNVTGTATTATNVNLSAGANNTNHSIVFSLNATGTGVGLSSDSSLLYNPSTNVLSTDVFSGNFTGTAATATNFYGTLTGNVTGTATTAQNLNTVAATTGTGHYLLFSPTNGGSGVAVSSDAQLQFSPATNVLTVDTVSGNLSGTAVTATNFYGSLTGNVTGTATTSQNVNVTTTTRTFDHYLLFTNASNGSGLALTTSAVGSGLTYNPATNTLNALFFTGTATTSRNVVVNTTTRSANHYLLFTPDSSGSGVALTTSTVGMGLTYNPATNTLSAQFFTGTATTARNVDVTTTTAGGNFYLTFTNASSGSGLALTTSAIGIGFTVNPAQNTLAAGTFIGNVSGSATTSTYITGILRNASYVQGDLLAGASTGNTLARLPVGANNRYFLKPDSTTQTGLGWSTFAGVFVTSLAPASPAFTLLEGDLWYKVDDGSFNVYYTDVDDTAQWVEIVSAGGAGGGSATPAGSNTYVQFNDSNAFGGVADFTFSKDVPSLAIKSFPTESPSGSTAAIVLTGTGVNFSGSVNGTFFAINSTSGFSGYMIDARKNGTTQFSVNNDGSTYVATLNSNGTVYSNSGVLTNTNPSDENLKENIQSMIGGTAIVNQLSPVSFEWKSGIGGTGTKYGFIAQEVQSVIPDIVSTDASGTIGIDTVSLIPFLVKSIKEQQETIEQLRSEIQFIKSELGI